MNKNLRERVEAYLALAEQASPGPWELRNQSVVDRHSRIVAYAPSRVGAAPGQISDGLLIKNAHEAAAIIREQRAEIQKLHAQRMGRR